MPSAREQIAWQFNMNHGLGNRIWPVGLLALLLLNGCGSPPRAHTTFLDSIDLVHMTDRMAESFASDDVIGERTSEDDPWVISVYRVVNHTNQIIPEHERWLYLGRLRSHLAQSDLAEKRRLIWVVPPERWPVIQQHLDESSPPELRMEPTHLLTATFDALTRTGPRGRSDTYLCAYQLVDLESGRVVWEDRWEMKKSVSGLVFD